MTEMAGLQQDPAPSSSRLTRIILRGAGGFLVALGVLGIFLPLLPTTVFLLGAAACFGKSSPGAYEWLTTNRLFGRYLREYREEKGATAGAKLFSISSLWIGIGAAVYFVREMPWAEVLLIAIAMAITVHLLSLRTVHK
ncbi:MAG: YbaN family protein [Dehalococcoidia bacterium]|nr:YbaN family protein [Dehalococcoidia bacterium]